MSGRGRGGYTPGVADDLELLAAWRSGDRGAGEDLLRRYFDPVCRFFRSKLGTDVEVHHIARVVAIKVKHALAAIHRLRGFEHNIRRRCRKNIADRRTITDLNLKPMSQDEWVLGVQHALGKKYKLGVRGTAREFGYVIDDMIVNPALQTWARANGSA